MGNESPKKGVSPAEAIGIVWDILFAIAIPTMIFGLLGRWLDNRYGTSPLFLAIGLLCSLAAAGLVVVRKGKRIADRL